jgi:hypothetical protein
MDVMPVGCQREDAFMGKTAKGKTTITAEIPEALRDRLDARAKAEGRSRSEVIGRAIAFFLEFAEVEKAAPPTVEVPRPKGKGNTK